MSLAVTDHGSASRAAPRALVLAHATGFCGGVWRPLVPALRERFRVITLDQRGHGDSDKPDDSLMEVAIRVANDVVAETLGSVDAATNAKLVSLAYSKLRDGGKPWDLPTYIKSLVSLIKIAKQD